MQSDGESDCLSQPVLGESMTGLDTKRGQIGRQHLTSNTLVVQVD